MAVGHKDLTRDEDTYVSIGTPFTILETDEDIIKDKHKKSKEAYVLDKQGRRRFHGAFTGGFSAGYYNTVGTKEGWSPATFTSSRKSKVTSKRQRPEDFMDEEDLDVFGIAPREVTTRDPFTKDTNNVTSVGSPSVIPGGPPLRDLIIPCQSTIGARLLEGMGWREGQGVGPKVPRMTQSDTSQKVYGCSLPSDQEQIEREGHFLFAPHDIAPWQFDIKDNLHGIGYKGMIEQGVLTSETYSNSLYGMRGQAFGVGALEEEDEDIYSQESWASYSHSLVTERELNTSLKYGWTGDQSESWSLDMFVKVKHGMSHLKYYPPPKVPHKFVPIHVFTTVAPQNVSRGPLSANERGHLVSGANKSVFEYMSASDKERLESFAKSRKDSLVQKTPPTKHVTTPISLPPLSNIGQTLIEGHFQPFANDPSKQQRYEAYLSGKRKFNDRDTSHFTEWERKKELDEFSRKARLLKPLSTSLNDKFTKSTTIHLDTTNEDTPTNVNEESIEAAKLGMFGVMTREQIDWYPHSVLCKRYNVPDPYPNSDTVGVLLPASSGHKRRVTDVPLTTSSASVQSVMEERREERGEGQKEVEEKEEFTNNTTERPPMSTFVSIFAAETISTPYVRKDYQQKITKRWTDLSMRPPLPTSPLPSLVQQQTIPVVVREEKEQINALGLVKEREPQDEDTFGPSLPPDLTTEEQEYITSVHKHSHKHHKHRHSSSHHKKAKHKRKH